MEVVFSTSTVQATREGIHQMAEQAWKRFLKTGNGADAERGHKFRHLQQLFDEIMEGEKHGR